MVRALAPWRPLDFDAYERLETIVGAAALTPMLARLRDDLAIGLELIEIGSGELSTKAHHLAGICGMLGFERTGLAWRSLFERPESNPSTAWRETRLAIAALDKIPGSRAEH
ncbi:MAG: hypothetical protein MK010_01540 [Erythrobacter sp.]|nr:hypothetical protein [Erythrobacter sp.]